MLYAVSHKVGIQIPIYVPTKVMVETWGSTLNTR